MLRVKVNRLLCEKREVFERAEGSILIRKVCRTK